MAQESMPAANSLGALPAVGEVVAGKYRIERMIAEGGMGVIYEATHVHLDELVAIKFLRADFIGSTDGEIAERFIREARASAKIRSEHVTRVHDVGKLENGAPYIVMERLHGQDLESLVEKTGILPLELGADYILQACEALAEAHAIGMVHRDLKPANLFLTHRADGSSCVKVLDFGISKFKDMGGVDNITKTSAVMGSPRYMSPEQMRSSRDVDARADVWAIGIILYELFAGTVPFDGESMPQICAAILQDEPKSLRALRPDISPELESVVARCLQKKPADRYDTIVPLAHELAQFGSANARASAERIARVLHNSGTNPPTSLPPRDFTRASDSGSVPAVRIRANASGNSATALEWTGTELAPIPKRKKTVFIVAGVAVLFVGSVAATTSIVLHNREVAAAHASMPVETKTPAMKADTPTPTAANPTTPNPTPNSAPTTNAPTTDVTLLPVAATTATTAATKSPGKKGTSASHPVTTTASHASATATTPSAPVAPSTPATPSTTKPAATGGDMWDERK